MLVLLAIVVMGLLEAAVHRDHPVVHLPAREGRLPQDQDPANPVHRVIPIVPATEEE